MGTFVGIVMVLVAVGGLVAMRDDDDSTGCGCFGGIILAIVGVLALIYGSPQLGAFIMVVSALVVLVAERHFGN